ncbi:hypothetical protein SOVF_213660, partial [Spinacia oleracea]
MASLELGRSDFAYWDLLMASHKDPKNPEVCRKLEEIKRSRLKGESEKQSERDVPVGLNLGLPPIKKKARRDSMNDHTKEQVLDHEKDHIGVERKVVYDAGLSLKNIEAE